MLILLKESNVNYKINSDKSIFTKSFTAAQSCEITLLYGPLVLAKKNLAVGCQKWYFTTKTGYDQSSSPLPTIKQIKSFPVLVENIEYTVVLQLFVRLLVIRLSV